MKPTFPERRRDPRLTLTGQAVLHPLTRAGRETFGAILDVSARGVRIRVRPGADLGAGDRMDLDLDVPLPSAQPTVSPVHLLGRGEVIRVDVGPEGSTEAAIRFEGPLAVGEAFAAAAAPVRVPPARSPA